jgi:HEAT repeat protein
MAGERSAALRNRAMRTLAEFAACRRETLAVAGAALSDADVKVRNAGFALLEQAGTNAVPYLMMAASDADAVTRRRAADIAAAMGDAGEAGVRLLSFMARDRDPAIRAQSLRVLTQYGDSRPLEVLAALQKSLADADRVVKDTAQRGFVDLCRGASEIQMSPATVSTILGILKSGPPDLAESIGEALARVGPSVVPALVEMVRAADRSLAGRAVVALGMMGPAAESAVPEMQRQSGLRNDPRFAAAVSNAVIEIRGTNAVEAGAPPR